MDQSHLREWFQGSVVGDVITLENPAMPVIGIRTQADIGEKHGVIAETLAQFLEGLGIWPSDFSEALPVPSF